MGIPAVEVLAARLGSTSGGGALEHDAGRGAVGAVGADKAVLVEAAEEARRRISKAGSIGARDSGCFAGAGEDYTGVIDVGLRAAGEEPVDRLRWLKVQIRPGGIHPLSVAAEVGDCPLLIVMAAVGYGVVTGSVPAIRRRARGEPAVVAEGTAYVLLGKIVVWVLSIQRGVPWRIYLVE